MTGSVNINHKKYLRILREYLDLKNSTKLVNINTVTTIYE